MLKRLPCVWWHDRGRSIRTARTIGGTVEYHADDLFVYDIVRVGAVVRILLIVLEAVAELLAEPDAEASGRPGPRRGDVELPVREDRSVKADTTTLQCLSLRLMDRHCPSQAYRKLPPPQNKWQAAG